MRTFISETESMLSSAMLPPLSPVSMLATPSIVMLLEFGRCPFAVNPLTWAGGPLERVPSLSAWGRTPGTSVVKPNSERPLFAMLVRAWVSSANDRSPLWVCSSLTRDETMTDSLIEPTSSTIVPADILSFGLTTSLACSSALKPFIVILRL